MKKYTRIDLTTGKGFKKAERLQSQGWKVILVGIDYLLMELEV